MKVSVFAALATFAVLGVATAVQAQEGDAEKGAIVFKKCMTCHRAGEGAKNMVGPVLSGVIGRQAGTYPGYSYSTLNHNAGQNGLIWNEETIFAYLPNPNAFLKKFLTDKGKPELIIGSTKMPFNLNSEEERKDVIAYLKTFSKK